MVVAQVEQLHLDTSQIVGTVGPDALDEPSPNAYGWLKKVMGLSEMTLGSLTRIASGEYLEGRKPEEVDEARMRFANEELARREGVNVFEAALSSTPA